MAAQGSPAKPSSKPDANPASDAMAAQDLPDPAQDKQTATGSGGPGGCQGSGGQALSQLLLSGDSAALAKRMQEAAREVGLTDIWFFTQKGFYTQKIQQAMGLELLDREISDAKRQTLAARRCVSSRVALTCAGIRLVSGSRYCTGAAGSRCSFRTDRRSGWRFAPVRLRGLVATRGGASRCWSACADRARRRR